MNYVSYLSLVLILIFSNISCKSSTDSKTEFVAQINNTKEIKLADKKIDSLRTATGIPFELSLAIIDDSPFKEDAGKNISIVFIEADWGVDHITLYTLKFDKSRGEIIEIVKNK